MPSIVTDKQRKRLLERPVDGSSEEALKDRRLNDFYVRKALTRWLDSIEDINLILDTLPSEQLDKNDIVKNEVVIALFKVVEKLVKTLDPPQIQETHSKNKYTGFCAVDSFQLGPFDDKYYYEDKDEKRELKSVGYSMIRDITEEENTIVCGILNHTQHLRNMITPKRTTLDCTYEEFLTKKLPDLIKEAKSKGVKYHVAPDRFDLEPIKEFDAEENVACLMKEGRI